MRRLLALALVLMATTAGAQDRILPRSEADAGSHFLAMDSDGGRCLLEGSDLTTRHPPWSTFKIPNLLIALETGAATGPGHWRDWDPRRRPAAGFWPPDWRQGQTLASAFRRSAVWYFSDLAQEIGGPTYREVLARWDYGNAVAPDGSDGFWLGGPLEISIEEQARFLHRLLAGELGPTGAQIAVLAEVSADPLPGLHGKTGSGPVEPGRFSGAFEGWYVGWVDGGPPAVFAHYMTAPSYAGLREARRERAIRFLRACGLRD